MTEGLAFFSTDPGNQLINSLLTGYKLHALWDKTFLSRDKNVELLNDVTCRTTRLE